MAFCTECGTNIQEGKKFCTGCGKPVTAAQQPSPETAQTKAVHTAAAPAPMPAAPAAPAPMPATPAAPAPMPAPPAAPVPMPEAPAAPAPMPAAPAPAAPMQAPAQGFGSVTQATGEPPEGSPYAVMSTGGFVGSCILMNIPVIGWLICIIWACGGCKNRNRRNFARANLIFLAIVALITLVGFLLVDWLIGLVVNYFVQFI